MNPRVVAIAGPLQGNIFELHGKELSMGRDDSNQISIHDFSVSRKHCVIRESGQTEFKIFDLESRNGICVNGIPTKERKLSHGDRIELGDSLFVFLIREVESSSEPADQLDAGRFTARSTIKLNPNDTHYFHAEKFVAKETLQALSQGLNILFKVTQAIHATSNLEMLAKELLELIFEAIPASYGALVLLDQEGEIASIYKQTQNSTESQELSRTVLAQVIGEHSGILSNDILHDEDTRKAKSLVNSQITSVLALPLMLQKRVIGVLYLSTTNTRSPFTEDHLHLVAAIAGIAAMAIENIKHMEWLITENKRLKQDVKIEHSMVGESPAMQKVYEFIAKVAPTDATVLISGESGTGKELVARALHENSPRVDSPFMVVNCATLTETLLESELFGYEKGAFTGAIEARKGKVEIADGGTVFLDEIGEIPATLQTKLLRLLQEREFDRVGGHKPIRVDVRFIAATNRNLEEAVHTKTFRSDLYYRLNVVNLTMPALRERKADIPLLVTYFASRAGKKSKRHVTGVSTEARSILQNHDWPGNVRELENAIERAVIMGLSDSILPEDLPESVLESQTAFSNTHYYEALLKAKREIVLKALDQASNNYTEAAKILGIHPNNLHRLIRNLDLKSRVSRNKDS